MMMVREYAAAAAWLALKGVGVDLRMCAQPVMGKRVLMFKTLAPSQMGFCCICSSQGREAAGSALLHECLEGRHTKHSQAVLLCLRDHLITAQKQVKASISWPLTFLICMLGARMVIPRD